jgi:hypothetical protein
MPMGWSPGLLWESVGQARGDVCGGRGPARLWWDGYFPRPGLGPRPAVGGPSFWLRNQKSKAKNHRACRKMSSGKRTHYKLSKSGSRAPHDPRAFNNSFERLGAVAQGLNMILIQV